MRREGPLASLVSVHVHQNGAWNFGGRRCISPGTVDIDWPPVYGRAPDTNCVLSLGTDFHLHHLVAGVECRNGRVVEGRG